MENSTKSNRDSFQFCIAHVKQKCQIPMENATAEQPSMNEQNQRYIRTYNSARRSRNYSVMTQRCEFCCGSSWVDFWDEIRCAKLGKRLEKRAQFETQIGQGAIRKSKSTLLSSISWRKWSYHRMNIERTRIGNRFMWDHYQIKACREMEMLNGLGWQSNGQGFTISAESRNVEIEASKTGMISGSEIIDAQKWSANWSANLTNRSSRNILRFQRKNVSIHWYSMDNNRLYLLSCLSIR
jgi:hypothetical protein